MPELPERTAQQRALMAASQRLLRCAKGGPRRIEFLQSVSETLLELCQADGLDLWMERGDIRYRWSAVRRSELRFELESLTRGAEPLIVAAVRRQSRPVGHFARTTRGSLWCSAQASEPAALLPRSQALIAFEIDGQNSGVLHLVYHTGALTEPLVEQHEELSRMLGFAIADRRHQAALSERVKELRCLYDIARIAAEPGRPLEEMLQAIVELLPEAWQYPELTSARITLDHKPYHTPGFETGPHRLAAGITIDGRPRGEVEVFYTREADTHDEVRLLGAAVFLPEEHHLLDGIAREVTFIIERTQAAADRVRLQEQIRHADRLATIGQLTAGVAHELNEPLTNILGFAQLMTKAAELHDQSRADLDKIVSATLYAREIIRKLMFFSRQTPVRRSEVDLNRIVEEAMSFLESRCLKEGIQVSRQLSPELPVVLGDPGQLQQVLVNLVVNAIQAMPNGGRLQVQTRAAPHEVRLLVEDQGVGIAAELLDRIFLPFFTTKDVGEGTGLGLSVVHGIVSEHGGRVEISSEPAVGSCFQVCLPVGCAGATERHDG